MPKKLYIITDEWLTEEYANKRRRPKEIAEELKCSKSYLFKRLKKLGLTGKCFNIKNDISGNEYNGIKVISPQENYGHGKYKYKCECKCGNTFYANKNQLIYGKTKRCVECRGQEFENNRHFTGFGYIPGTYWYQIKRGASSRGIELNVTIEQLNDLFISQNMKCALTNLPLCFQRFDRKKRVRVEQTASLDRINSAKGYVTDNIHWIHKYVNIMKMDYSLEEYTYFCMLVYKNTKLKLDSIQLFNSIA